MENKSALEAKLVEEFVVQSHSNLDSVKELLAKEPGLVNATWDWGGGDFESALGAAGHMGRKDIAEYLLSNGARLDIFVAAMLGKLEIVKAILDAFPDALESLGPQGISLLEHAITGGEDAQEVFELISSLR